MRYELLSLVSVIVLGSCSQAMIDQDIDVSPNGLPVCFDIYSPNLVSTKAAIVEFQDLKDDGFLMYANSIDANTGSSSPFMNAQKVTYQTDSWKYSPVKYWPTDVGAKLDFYPRYTDGSDNIRITYDWNNVPQVTFSVNKTVSKQSDMLWASPILGARSSDYVNKPVTVSFKHALTSFYFNIRLDKSYENTTVKVKSLTLTGYFAPKATMKAKETDINKIWNLEGDWEKRSYTISASGDDEIYADAANGNISTGTSYTRLTGDKGSIMVLPFDNTEYDVTLNYDVTVTTSGTPVTSSYSVQFSKTGVNLVPGSQITSNMTLTLNPISFVAQLTDLPTQELELENIVGFSELQNALQTGGSFRLIDDMTIPASATRSIEIPAGKTVNLDLNGKTISADPSLSLTTGIFQVAAGGKLVISGNGTIDGGNCYSAIQVKQAGEEGNTALATLVIENGTFKGKYYGVCGNGLRNNTDITINGGTFMATDATDGLGLYHPQSGKLTINGGTFIGKESGVEVRAGKIFINGGTFESTGSTLSCTPNDNGSTAKGAGFAVVQHISKPELEVEINGGTFKGQASLYANDIQNNNSDNDKVIVKAGTFNGAVTAVNVPVEITGGSYSDDPSTYVKTGYTATADGSGRYVVNPE